MNSVVFWALDRAKEPSTWAGLAGLAMVFGISAEQPPAYLLSPISRSLVGPQLKLRFGAIDVEGCRSCN